MFKFILGVTCPVCGELVRDDQIFIDFTVDEPVVNLDHFSQQSFHCENCNIDIYTMDTKSIIDYDSCL